MGFFSTIEKCKGRSIRPTGKLHIRMTSYCVYGITRKTSRYGIIRKKTTRDNKGTAAQICRVGKNNHLESCP